MQMLNFVTEDLACQLIFSLKITDFQLLSWTACVNTP